MVAAAINAYCKILQYRYDRSVVYISVTDGRSGSTFMK
jgi:hypothetical protein